MKKVVCLLLIVCSSHLTFSQRKWFGINLGYQVGKKQYFESGLNFTLISKKVGSSVILGYEDDVNSRNFGYKLGLTLFSNSPKLPVSVGINYLSYKYNSLTYNCIRPEIGFTSDVLYGGSEALIQFIYGYNINLNNQTDTMLNKHLFRLSINTSFRGLTQLFSLILF